MIGGSYDGTTANMVASQGAKVPELRAIVPIAAISRWYGYAYGNGVRYFLNSEVPSDEGFDTPLAFDFGLTRTPPTDPSDPQFAAKLAVPREPVRVRRAHGQGLRPLARLRLASGSTATTAGTPARFRAATLVVHGWQDYNVKQEEGVELFEALPVAGSPAGTGAPARRAACRSSACG